MAMGRAGAEPLGTRGARAARPHAAAARPAVAGASDRRLGSGHGRAALSQRALAAIRAGAGESAVRTWAGAAGHACLSAAAPAQRATARRALARSARATVD